MLTVAGLCPVTENGTSEIFQKAEGTVMAWPALPES